MQFTLYPDQRATIDALFAAVNRGVRAPVIQGATGKGKSVEIAEAVRRLLDTGRVLVFVHRSSIVNSLAATIASHCKVPVGVEMASDNRRNTQAPVIVATNHTIGRLRDGRSLRLAPYDPDSFSAIIVDEMHHAIPTNSTYANVLEHFGILRGGVRTGVGPLLIGFTATTQRGDGVGLDSLWDEVVATASVTRMVAEDRLVPTAIRRLIPHGYAGTQAPDQILFAKAIEHYRKEGEGRQFLAFVKRKAQAHACARAWRRAGLRVEAVTEDTPQTVRDRLEADYKCGRLHGLVNVQCYTEGTDLPMCGLIYLCRRVRAQANYIQIVGRGSRMFDPAVWNARHPETPWDPAPLRLRAEPKQDCVLIDLCGSSSLHALDMAPTLLGDEPEPRCVTAAKNRVTAAWDLEIVSPPGYYLERDDPLAWQDSPWWEIVPGQWARVDGAWQLLGHDGRIARVLDGGRSPRAGRWLVVADGARQTSWSGDLAAFRWAERLLFGAGQRPVAPPPPAPEPRRRATREEARDIIRRTSYEYARAHGDTQTMRIMEQLGQV